MRRVVMDLRLEQHVDAPPARAFEVFTKPESVSRWFTTRHEADLRPGGCYHNADGDAGAFTRVEPPALVEFTWDNAKHCPGTLVTVEFAAEPRGGTRVVLVHSRLASAAHVEEMKVGWSWALDSFKSFVETGTAILHEQWLAARAKPHSP